MTGVRQHSHYEANIYKYLAFGHVREGELGLIWLDLPVEQHNVCLSVPSRFLPLETAVLIPYIRPETETE